MYINFQLPLMQGPFNMEVSSTILLLTQGINCKTMRWKYFWKSVWILEIQCLQGVSNIHNVHKCRSYFFYSEKSWSGKRHPISIYKCEIWIRIKIKFFDHIMICLLSFEHFSREPFSSGHIRIHTWFIGSKQKPNL